MTTPQGRALTLAHTNEQLQLRRQMVADLRALWPLMSWDDLEGTFPAWADAVAALVAAGRQRSATLAAAYIEAFGITEGAPLGARALMVDAVAREQMTVNRQALDASLHATSVAVAKRSAGVGLGRTQAMQRALVASSGAATRIVLAGGRATVHESVRRDPNARGYARILNSARPCEFCALLATRGPVYTSRTARFEAHDHCDCGAEPVYGRWDPQPQVKALQDLYESSTRTENGGRKLVAFRAAYREQLGT